MAAPARHSVSFLFKYISMWILWESALGARPPASPLLIEHPLRLFGDLLETCPAYVGVACIEIVPLVGAAALHTLHNLNTSYFRQRVMIFVAVQVTRYELEFSGVWQDEFSN